MSEGKRNRQIGKLVELLRNRYGASSIYVEDMANCLECSHEFVQDQLHLLYEKGIIEPAWELHCSLCGSVAASYQLPRLFQKGPMVGPCPGCLSWIETGNLSVEDLVMAYQFTENGIEILSLVTESMQKNDVTSDGKNSIAGGRSDGLYGQ